LKDVKMPGIVSRLRFSVSAGSVWRWRRSMLMVFSMGLLRGFGASAINQSCTFAVKWKLGSISRLHFPGFEGVLVWF
jgi:hypothetical protein